MEKTKIGLNQNVAAAIAYSLPPIAWITGIVMLILETENKYVRFHAMQSFILGCAFGITTTLLAILPFIGKMLAGFLGIFVLVAWIIMLVNALSGKYYKFPIIGELIYNKIVE